MASKITAGIRFNEPVAKHMYVEMDRGNMQLDVYVTGVYEGTEVKLKGTISEWVPVVQEG